MHARCPHCQNAIELINEAELSDIDCPSCGSSFNLLGDSETQSLPRSSKKVVGHFELTDRYQSPASRMPLRWQVDCQQKKFDCNGIPAADKLGGMTTDNCGSTESTCLGRNDNREYSSLFALLSHAGNGRYFVLPPSRLTRQLTCSPTANGQVAKPENPRHRVKCCPTL